MNIQILVIYSCIFSSLITIIRASTFSALRYGSDSSSNDIQIGYRTGDSQFYLSFSTSFDYINSGFKMCFRERNPTISYFSGSTCSLQGQKGNYNCFGYSITSGTYSYQYFQLSSDLTIVSKTQTFTPNTVISGSNYSTYSISLSGTLANSTPFSYFSNSQTIYEILSNPTTSFYGSNTYKINYMTSFPKLQNVTVDNVIMPRNFACFIYNNSYFTGVFYGGVYRANTPIMMFALVTINTNGIVFGAWQGLSFSVDHAYRDMIGIVLNSGTITDLYSLYASAPYQDTSTNIGGTNDVYLIYSSGLSNQMAMSYLYTTQFFRNYDTGDSSGDEVLMYKINNQYCLASYFYVGEASSFTAVPTSSSYKHQTLNCFMPDLTLFSNFTNLLQLILLINILLTM